MAKIIGIFIDRHINIFFTVDLIDQGQWGAPNRTFDVSDSILHKGRVILQ